MTNLPYTEEECLRYTKELFDTVGNECLQAWWTSPHVNEHVAKLMLWARIPFDEFGPSLRCNLRILDISCGTGGFAFRMQQMLPNSEVFITNLWKSQCEDVCRFFPGRFTEHNFNQEVCSDAVDRIDDGLCTLGRSFDYVFMNYALGHMSNRRMYEYFYDLQVNVLRKGGRVVMWDIAPATTRVASLHSYRLIPEKEIYDLAEQVGLTVERAFHPPISEVMLMPMNESDMWHFHNETVPVFYSLVKEI